MSIEEHERRAQKALETADQYRGWLGKEFHIAIVGAYSSLALAHFAAADIERRKEADQYQGGTVGARTLPAHWHTSTTEEADRG